MPPTPPDQAAYAHLIHTCHALRISCECYVQKTLSGTILHDREYVQVPASFFREMLDALAAADTQEED